LIRLKKRGAIIGKTEKKQTEEEREDNEGKIRPQSEGKLER